MGKAFTKGSGYLCGYIIIATYIAVGYIVWPIHLTTDIVLQAIRMALMYVLHFHIQLAYLHLVLQTLRY